ncbi:MAG: NYN domain-containing protein [Chloroflexota bacterium]
MGSPLFLGGTNYAKLNKLPRFEVRLGRLVYRGLDPKGKPIFEQKRVDLMMGVDLVLLSAKHQITHAAILAGDSDFIPAIEAAKDEGVLIHLYHGRNPHSELWDAADERLLIDRGFTASLLRH